MSESPLKPFSRLLSDGLLSNLVGTPNKSRIPVSTRQFAILVQNVNSTTSKHDEEQIIKRELQVIKEGISEIGVSPPQIRDYLCRILYCHMLGYDVKWSHIDALKLACGNSLLEKRIGYLAACLMMDRETEIALLLTSTMTKDICSSNIVENITGLYGAAQLISKERIPFMLEYVISKLTHPRELVRQKAVMCLHQFLLLAPDQLEHHYEDLQKLLYDKDPGVMAAAVHIVQTLISKSPENYKAIGSSLLDILNQVIYRKMSSAFEYHSIQLPWLQINILRCLSTLVLYHERLKEDLCLLMKEILQRLNLKEHMGFAILYECICCIIAMQPDRTLLDMAAQHVGRLLRSSEPNLKYMGVKALTQLVRADSQYAMSYQSLIVDSLESEEVNIQKKMYKLLYQIANKTNVEAVCSKLMQYFTLTTDKYWRSEVISMVIDLAERLSPSVDWQIQTVLSCVQQGGDLIDSTVVRRVMDLLEKEYVVKSDVKSHQILVQKCVSCLLMKNATPALIHISAWTVGELCVLLKKMPEDRVMALFTKHLCDPDLSFSVKSVIVSSLQKLLLNKVVTNVSMVTNLKSLLEDQQFVIKQRISLLLKLCGEKLVIEKQDPDSVDTTLSFLDDHVSQWLESGGTPYIPVHLRKPFVPEPDESSLFQGTSTPNKSDSVDSRGRSYSKTSSNKMEEEDETGIKLDAKKKVWGRQGRINEDIQDIKATLKEFSSSRESREKKKLSSALFSGIQSPNTAYQNIFTGETEDNQGLMMELSDNAGWRSAFSNISLQSDKLVDSNQLELSPTLTDIEIPRGQDLNSEPGLEFNTMEMLDDVAQSDSNKGCDSLHLNSSAFDLNDNMNFELDPQKIDLTDSLGSTNDLINDAVPNTHDDTSSFLNISVSSTDQSQINLKHTRSSAGTRLKILPDGEILDSCQIVTVQSDNSDQNDQDVQLEDDKSIYSEVVSLYDDDDET